jgi:hypothetical protein
MKTKSVGRKKKILLCLGNRWFFKVISSVELMMIVSLFHYGRIGSVPVTVCQLRFWLDLLITVFPTLVVMIRMEMGNSRIRYDSYGNGNFDIPFSFPNLFGNNKYSIVYFRMKIMKFVFPSVTPRSRLTISRGHSDSFVRVGVCCSGVRKDKRYECPSESER